jgi:hypothetical protein
MTKVCVFFDVGTESLITIKTSFAFKRLNYALQTNAKTEPDDWADIEL